MMKTREEFEFGDLIKSVNEVLERMIHKPIPQTFLLMHPLQPVNGGRLNEKEIRAIHRTLSGY